MALSTRSLGNPVFALTAVIGGIFLLQAGSGLFVTLLSLRLSLEGFSPAAIGSVVTAYPFGFLLGCLFGAKLVRSVGHIRAFAAFAATLSCAALGFAAAVEPVFWTLLRVITGFAAAGLFMVGESWLNAKAPPESRGTIFAVYMISNMTAVTLGQLLLVIEEPTGPSLFMVAAALFSACLIPVALTRTSAPELPQVESLGLRGLYRVSPLGVVGCIATGLINTAVAGIAPVYASRIGLATAQVAALMAMLQFGGLLLQWPIGRLSDRFDRRHVLFWVTIAVGVLALAIGLFGHISAPVLFALVLLYGGVAYTVYPLCVAHANDLADAEQMVSVSAGLLFAWSLGSVAGPLLASLAMERLGPAGLFHYVAVVAFALAGYAAWRMRVRTGGSVQAPFVPHSLTTPVASELHPHAGGLPETENGAVSTEEVSDPVAEPSGR